MIICVARQSFIFFKIDDINETILRFPNSVIAGIHLDFFQRPYFKSCKIKSSKGTLQWDSTENQINFYTSKTKKWSKIKVANNYNLSGNKINKMYIEELHHFLSCIKKHSQPMNNLSEAESILNVTLCMKKSSSMKKTIKI